METLKAANSVLNQMIDLMPPWVQAVVAGMMAALSHLDECAAILAVLVLVFQARAAYFKSKREKMAFSKECKEE